MNLNYLAVFSFECGDYYGLSPHSPVVYLALTHTK